MKDESLDNVLAAIRVAADEKGFVFATLDSLCDATGYSRMTVRRSIEKLADLSIADIDRKRGPGGGYRIVLRPLNTIGTQSEHNRNTIAGDAMSLTLVQGSKNREPEPKSALTQSEHNSPQPTGPAYRAAKADEIPASGAEVVYVNDEPGGYWRRLSATLWEAPNGDAVSIRSMTPELRWRLGADRNADGTPNAAAIKALRGMLDR